MLRLPSFTYLQPKTLAEALRMKGDAGPEGMFVAGGTDLYPNMKRRHQEPKTVISLMGIPELAADGRIGGSADGVTIGACMRLTRLSDHPARPPPPASSPHRSFETWAPSAVTSASIRAAITTTRVMSGGNRSTSA